MSVITVDLFKPHVILSVVAAARLEHDGDLLSARPNNKEGDSILLFEHLRNALQIGQERGL